MVPEQLEEIRAESFPKLMKDHKMSYRFKKLREPQTE